MQSCVTFNEWLFLRTGSCQRNYTQWNDNCYKFVTSEENHRWVEAEKACERDDATLVSIITLQEMEFIQYMLTNVWITQVEEIYIGKFVQYLCYRLGIWSLFYCYLSSHSKSMFLINGWPDFDLPWKVSYDRKFCLTVLEEEKEKDPLRRCFFAFCFYKSQKKYWIETFTDIMTLYNQVLSKYVFAMVIKVKMLIVLHIYVKA